MDKQALIQEGHGTSGVPENPEVTEERSLRKKPAYKDLDRKILPPEVEKNALNKDGYALLTCGNIEVFNALRGKFPMWRPDFAGKDFSGMNLAGVDLNRAHLVGVNFTGTVLKNADFWLANLTNAQLSGADLENAKCQLATLNGADLKDTDLRKTDISNASLQGAKLQGANLQTDITNVKFTNAEFDATTKLPPAEEFLRTNLDMNIDHEIIFPATLPVDYSLQIQEMVKSKNARENRVQEYR